MAGEFKLDLQRGDRLGLDEAIFCLNKTNAQINAIVADADARSQRLFLTRLNPEQFAALNPQLQEQIDYHAVSQTACFGSPAPVAGPARVAIVTAGSSDANVAWEAVRTIAFHGVACDPLFDVGVAGLWRLLDQVDRLRLYPVVIAIAGMDAALPSVVGGLLPGAIIGVPTSTGYGVASGGETALKAMLASCAPGIAVVNIDNGYGAGCAALRILAQIDRAIAMS